MLQDPAHSKIRHADVGRNYPPNSLDRIQRNIEVYSRKRLSPVEPLPVTIITAMVISGELCLSGNIATE
jgi:hypothetical protein